MSQSSSPRQYAEDVFVPRSTCYRCFRPESLCYCADIPSIENRTRVVIVQHPREQFHPLNTARIAEHGLSRSVVIRSAPAQLASHLSRHEISESAAILFPSDDAEDLEEIAPEDFPDEFIIVDGTWSHAKTLLRDVLPLGRYRKIRFTPLRPSEYKIRKEPRVDYLSTIESVAHVLRHIEPETPGIDGLNRAFVRMIERNIQAREPSEEGGRCKKKARHIPHRFPEALLSAHENFVVAYCEGTSRFTRDKRDGGTGETAEKEPLVVHLKRFSTGESLELVLKTHRVPPWRLLNHLALNEEAIDEHGISKVEAAERIRAFLRDDEVPVVWNASSRQILEEIGVEMRDPLVLKGVYCDFLTYQARRGEREMVRSWGSMSEILERLDIVWERPSAEGRGARRVVQTEALLGWICTSAAEHCEAFGS